MDKFNYLRSLLERTAYDAIAGLTLSSANYREAIEILQKRFGNKQLIISKHIEHGTRVIRPESQGPTTAIRQH